MKPEQIIQQLRNKREPYEAITRFSEKPGIYALFFYGEEFPLEGYTPKKDEIIYIGKTESSQLSRDKHTHFATGKTGSSTLRKSFGAMLRTELGLIPIPRGESDILKGKWSHFKFDTDSEEKLTSWMKSNLGLSFYEFDKYKQAIDELETVLIKELIPVLNIDHKNPNNPFWNELRALRKETNVIAYANHTSEEKLLKGSAITIQSTPIVHSKTNNKNKHKYVPIWESISDKLIKAISKNQDFTISMNPEWFHAVGNRKSYAFRINFINGEVMNTISGSAVARDLVRVLQQENNFTKATRSKTVSVKMDKYFTLKLER